MSTPVLTASALAALTLFMIVSLLTATGPANTLQTQLATTQVATIVG